MAKSLQEQLLAAGLVDKKRAHKIEQDKRRTSRQATLSKQEKRARAEQARKLADHAQVAKQSRDRELNRKRQEALEGKAMAAEVRQLIETGKLDREGADIAYQFVFRGKIKKINVTAEQRDLIVAGSVAIVRFSGKADLVPPEIAAKIRERYEGAVVCLDEAPGSAAVDDGYEAFQVPDDLMW